MADAGVVRIRIEARLTSLRNESRIDRDPDNVLAGRNRRLSVSPIKQEVLSAEPPIINICPAFTDPLIPGHADRTTVSEMRFIVRIPSVGVILLDVDHAKAALGRTPNESVTGIDQLIERVVSEMIMIVATRELKEAICEMLVGIADGQVGIANVRRRYGEAHQGMLARRDMPFLDAAKCGREIF